MDDHDETLSKRLQAAALQRTSHESERVDDFVLDADGVIDLRRLDDPDDARSVATPPAALRATRGRFGDAGDVGHLYDDSEPQGWFRRRRRRGRRPAAGSEPGSTTTVEPTHAPVDDADERAEAEADSEPIHTPERAIGRLTSEEVFAPAPPVRPATPEVDASPPDPEDEGTDLELDLRDGPRPTATCPKCGATGQRDLFDRVSQTSYYSCDDCTHMWQQSDPG